MKRAFALVIAVLFASSLLFSIVPNTVFATHVRNKTISFSAQNAVDGDWNFADGTTAAQARFFGGDASPSLWLHGGVLADEISVSGIFCDTSSNNCNIGQGEMIELVDGSVPQSAPYSLRKLIDDMSFTCDGGALTCLDSQTNFFIDPYVFTTLNDCNPSSLNNLVITFSSTVRMRIVNPQDITAITNLQFQVQQGAGIYDGVNKIENKDAYRTRTVSFTDANKTQGVQFSYGSNTLTFDGTGTLHPSRVDDFSKNYIKLNVGLDEFIKMTQNTFTYTTGKNVRLKFDVYYDDIRVTTSTFGIGQTTGNIDTTIDPDPKGTCTTQTGEGTDELRQIYRLRSVWNFDTNFNIPNNGLNPDGYENWDFVAGRNNETTGGVKVPTQWNIARNTEQATSDGKSIKFHFEHVQGTGRVRNACTTVAGDGADESNASALFLESRQMNFTLQKPSFGEPLGFGFDYFGTAQSTTTGGIFTTPCTLEFLINVIVTTPQGSTIQTITETNTVTFGGSGANNVASTGQNFIRKFFVFNTASSSITKVNVFVDIALLNIAGSTAGACGATNCGSRYYDLWMDTYVSNYDVSGKLPTASCALDPELCFGDNTGEEDPTSGETTGNDFCLDNPTNSSCVGVVDTSGGTGDVTVTVGTLSCTNGQFNFGSIDLSDTDTATQTSSQFIENIMQFVSCSPAFTGMMFALFGLVIAPAILMRENAVPIILILVAVWALMASVVVQVIPFWISFIVMALCGGFLVTILRKPTGQS